MNNTLYLRRRSKICLPVSDTVARLPLHYVASILKNLEALGFTFSQSLIEACQALSLEQLTRLYQELIVDLRQAKGAHQLHKPMYPNFPAQVMEMSRAELYINAIVHYLTQGRYLPTTERKERMPLLDVVELQVIDLGAQEEFERLFTQLAASNTSLSEQDKEDLTWFAKAYGAGITRLLPDAIPQKENMAFVAGLLMQHTDNAAAFIEKFCRTATDILRLAATLSGGDVSLATATRFRSFTRRERSLLLDLLNRPGATVEDMLRWKKRWIRLGERLHPGEYAKKYPRAAEAFQILRNDVPVPTFNSRLEQSLATKDISASVAQLSTRPGDYARRLDHLLRLDTNTQSGGVEAFRAITGRVSTPVLLQVRQHFLRRNESSPLRVFFPKGNIGKAYATPNALPELPQEICQGVVQVCEAALGERFRALPPLGKVYIDPELANFPVPFASRSASKAFRTLARGSKLPLPVHCNTLRFFVWWKNGAASTDIDLSATLFAPDFSYVSVVSYYDLKNFGGHHSGDIVDAPEGASEFIDISLEKVRAANVRYIVMSLNSYTHQPFCDLPECFAGWMAREHADSGEIYEPKTVQNRLDLTANTRIALPLIIDVVDNQVIWCDVALTRNPRWVNNVHGNLNAINLTLQSLTSLNKPNLYDLFTLHAQARGEQVAELSAADTVFSVAKETPYCQEEITSGYLI